MWKQQGAGGSYESVPLTSKGNDIYTGSFAASGTIEYFVQAVDELGNGPSKSQVSTLHVSGKAGGEAVASNEPKKRRGRGKRKKAATEETAAPAESAPADSGGGEAKAEEPAKTEAAPAEEAKAEDKGPPVVEHEKPTDAKEGEALTLKVKVTGNTITQSLAWFRKAGEGKFSTKIPLEHKDGDDYEATIPAEVAKGTIEYVFIVADAKGQKTTQGDGGPGKAFQVSFGKGGEASAKAETGGEKASGGAFVFAHKAWVHGSPGVGLSLRVQATPDSEDNAPDKAMVIYRGKDGGDAVADLAADESGGIGGFAGTIPAPAEGALYYQIVACKGTKCGVDTGSKKAWHGVAVSNDADAKAPEALDAASDKAPAGLPE
jgi:hypothetical protein